MIDRNDVIMELETCMASSCRGFKPGVYCPFNDDVWSSIRDALELLKAQEPVKAKEAIWPHRGVFGKCGVCNSPLPVIEGIKSKFCCMCGRAVKWE